MWPNVQSQRQPTRAFACSCWSSEAEADIHMWNVWKGIPRDYSTPDSHENSHWYELSFDFITKFHIHICDFGQLLDANNVSDFIFQGRSPMPALIVQRCFLLVVQWRNIHVFTQERSLMNAKRYMNVSLIFMFYCGYKLFLTCVSLSVLR